MTNWTCKLLICLGLVAALAPAAPAQQNPPADQGLTLSDQVVQQILEPLQMGMQTQNIQLVLSLFDKKELNSYSDLQGQLLAFFQQFDEVNFRYRLLQVTADKEHGSATAEMEMDALPYGLTQVPVRRSVQMRLQLKLGSKGWKIAGFTPSDFFNVEYSQK